MQCAFKCGLRVSLASSIRSDARRRHSSSRFRWFSASVTAHLLETEGKFLSAITGPVGGTHHRAVRSTQVSLDAGSDAGRYLKSEDCYNLVLRALICHRGGDDVDCGPVRLPLMQTLSRSKSQPVEPSATLVKRSIASGPAVLDQSKDFFASQLCFGIEMRLRLARGARTPTRSAS